MCVCVLLATPFSTVVTYATAGGVSIFIRFVTRGGQYLTLKPILRDSVGARPDQEHQWTRRHTTRVRI